jgi:hypothetical protein
MSLSKFLLNLQPVNSISIDRILPTQANSYSEIGSFSVPDGMFSLYISSRANSDNYSIGKQHSFSVQYNQTYGAWFTVDPVDSTPQDQDDYALDCRVANEVLSLRIRRTRGIETGVVYINIQNAGGEDYSYFPAHMSGVVGIVPTSNIAVILAGTGTNDHDSLLNKGAHRHIEIDAHLNASVDNELKSNKGQPNGYAGLDVTGKVALANLPAGVGAHGSTHAAGGSDPLAVTDLVGGSGLENIGNKNHINGYAGLDASGKIFGAQLPLGSAETYASDLTLSGNKFVVLDSAGKLVYADRTIMAHAGKVLGMTVGATVPPAQVSLLSKGEIANTGTWNFTIGGPVYLSINGGVTQSAPTINGFVQVVGYASKADTLFINIQPPVLLA